MTQNEPGNIEGFGGAPDGESGAPVAETIPFPAPPVPSAPARDAETGRFLPGNFAASQHALRSDRLPPEFAHLAADLAEFIEASVSDDGGESHLTIRRRSLHNYRARVHRRVLQLDAAIELRGLFDKRGKLRVAYLQQLHGAAARVAVDATAFSHRGYRYDFAFLTQWSDPEDTDRNLRWTRDAFAAMEPHLEAGVYVNNLGEEGTDRVRAAFGANYDRLVAVKSAYDPDNMFRSTQNIAPVPRMAVDGR